MIARARFLVLIAALSLCSGYRFRCYWMCTDETAIQDDYIEVRDKCREFSNLKLDMAMRNANAAGEAKSSKDMLVSLFSECMGNNGWNVSGKEATKTVAEGVAPGSAAPSAAAAASAAVAPAVSAKASLSRTAECDFARANAASSDVYAKRAESCNLECSQAMRNAPGAPRPAACPASSSTKLGTGSERTD